MLLVSLRIGGRGFSSILQAALLFLLARRLSPPSFSEFIVQSSILLFISALLSFGISIRLLDRRRIPRELAERFFAMRVNSSMLLLLVGIALIIVRQGPIEVSLFSSVTTLSDYWTDYVQAERAGRGRQLASVLWILFQRCSILVAYCVGLVTFDGSSDGALLILPLLVASTWVMISVYRVRMPYHIAQGFSSMWRDRSYWLAASAGNIAQLQGPALSMRANALTVGAFGIGLRAGNPIAIVPQAVQSVLIPKLKQQRLTTMAYRRWRSRYLGLGYVYGAGIACISPLLSSLIVRLLGPQYASQRQLITACIIAAGIYAVCQMYEGLFIIGGVPKYASYAMIPTNLLAILLFIIAGAGSILVVSVISLLCPLLMLVIFVLLSGRVPVNVGNGLEISEEREFDT